MFCNAIYVFELPYGTFYAGHWRGENIFLSAGDQTAMLEYSAAFGVKFSPGNDWDCLDAVICRCDQCNHFLYHLCERDKKSEIDNV